jgi:hypothetical protein
MLYLQKNGFGRATSGDFKGRPLMACPTFLIGHHQDAALAIPLATMPGPVQDLTSDGRALFFCGERRYSFTR